MRCGFFHPHNMSVFLNTGFGKFHKIFLFSNSAGAGDLKVFNSLFWTGGGQKTGISFYLAQCVCNPSVTYDQHQRDG